MAIEKYLAHYAEPECQLLKPLLNGPPEHHRYRHPLSDTNHEWQYVLVIPAYDEKPEFFDRLAVTLLAQQAVLLILVVNQPDTLSSATEANHNLVRHLQQRTTGLGQAGHLSLGQIQDTHSALLTVRRIDRHLQIPAGQGVGLARKIGADIATWLIYSGRIESPWIFCTDADCHLPSNYFSGAKNAGTAAAVVFPFHHVCPGDRLGYATRLYELSLNHYVEGLRGAGSPYAFHTVGSIFGIHSRHYCQVRGFPKRAGGEDFYLLNKLAKTAPIRQLDQPLISIEARLSGRVPFGTGPAVNQILAMTNPALDFRCYNPVIFTELGHWLSALPALRHILLEDLPLSNSVVNLLNSMGIQVARDHALKHSKSVDGFVRQMHIWFDGFRTLKLVHGLQRNGYPPVAIGELYDLDSLDPKT